MTIGELIELLQQLPENSTIGVLEFLFLNSTGYDEIIIKPRAEVDVEYGDKSIDYYIIGRYSEWRPKNKEERSGRNENRS